MNALFQFRGVWHLMQQWHLRPHTAVGHAVSHDLLTWQRVADVLQSGATADEQCYDGSASLGVLVRAGRRRRRYDCCEQHWSGCHSECSWVGAADSAGGAVNISTSIQGTFIASPY